MVRRGSECDRESLESVEHASLETEWMSGVKQSERATDIVGETGVVADLLWVLSLIVSYGSVKMAVRKRFELCGDMGDNK